MAKAVATKDSQTELKAFQQVHAALLPLSVEQRGRLIAAVTTLLATSDAGVPSAVVPASDARTWATATRSVRPMSLVEMLKEKAPATSAGKITLFAYHREKNEGKPRFSRGDLQGYFATAHENPPANYDRDFIAAVKKGWIHEGADAMWVAASESQKESGSGQTRQRRGQHLSAFQRQVGRAGHHRGGQT